MTELTPDRIIMMAKLRKITNLWGPITSVLNSNTVLCGGLVLQTILGENWNTDIDIFTTEHLTSIDGLQFNRCCDDSYTIIPGVKDLYRGEFYGVKIDIIHMTSLDDVFSGFDFDFCKVSFDGQHFHMKNPYSVLHKVCTLHESAVCLKKASERIPKYEARGFTIKRQRT